MLERIETCGQIVTAAAIFDKKLKISFFCNLILLFSKMFSTLTVVCITADTGAPFFAIFYFFNLSIFLTKKLSIRNFLHYLYYSFIVFVTMLIFLNIFKKSAPVLTVIHTTLTNHYRIIINNYNNNEIVSNNLL